MKRIRSTAGDGSRRAREAATLVAASTVPATFARSLTGRSTADQALVTGLTYLLAYGGVTAAETLVQGLARAVAAEDDGEDTPDAALVADLVAVLVGAAARLIASERPRERLPRSSVRTAGTVLGSGAAAAILADLASRVVDDEGDARRLGPLLATAVVTAARELEGRWSRPGDDGLDRDELAGGSARALLMGSAVAGTAVAAGRLHRRVAESLGDRLAQVLPGGTDVWRPVASVGVVAGVAAAVRLGVQQVFTRIEGAQTAFEAALDVPPPQAEVSGSPASLVPFDTMSRMGRRFVWTIRPPDEIERVMGDPAVAHPVRIYGGLGLADDAEERVRLVLDDLERAGGLDRSWLLVASPTGTGYVNYAAVGALELLTRGDCASVALQYGARPSPLSLDRVAQGRRQYRLLIDGLAERLATRGRRPTVVAFGESLGAWTSQDAFLHEGTDGLRAAGIDRALWIGTPFESKWKDQVLADDRDDVEPGLVTVIDSLADWEALPAERRAGTRYVMLTHHDDGVARFGASLLVRRPVWLGPPETRPRGVPRSQRWSAPTTFVQTLIDMKNAARVVPGVFEANGHDYRADLPGVIRSVLGLVASSEQVERVTRALEAEEAVRTHWIAEHGRVGEGMSSVLLRRIREEHPDAFDAAFADLRAEVRGWRDRWEEQRD